jgi:Tfp pilus assembly protein PilV
MNIFQSQRNKEAEVRGQKVEPSGLQICNSTVSASKYFSGGFTLVETLIAITVLMIAISGPLVVANDGLTAALYARDQMTATFLAQESMETIKNFRDTNLAAGNNSNDSNSSQYWLSYSGFHIDGCTLTNSCDASALDASSQFSGNPFVQNCPAQSIFSGQSDCQLYSEPSGYVHNANDFENGVAAVATSFYRHFYLIPVTNPVTNEDTVHVVVDWKEGTVPYQVDISSELVNTER